MIQREFLIRITAIAMLVLTIGCANTYKSTGDFNPAEPLRVAVLPFYQMVDGIAHGEAFEASLAIDELPLLSSKPIDSPASFVEESVRTALRRTGMEVVNPAFVRLQLGHHGFVRDRVVSVPVLLDSSPQKLGQLLLADALLYGVVTDWTRSYYGVESINTVGVDLRLVRATDGAQLWKSTAQESQGRGLSGIPTGFSSLVLEPLKGLDQKSIEQLAYKVVNKTFEPLFVKRKAAEAKSSGPVILGAVAFGRVPLGRAVSRQAPGARRLTVLVVGSGGKRVSAKFVKQGIEYSLLEGEPGHYTAEVELEAVYRRLGPQRLGPQRFGPQELLPQRLTGPGESGLKAGEVLVTIIDEFGREAQREIPIRF